MKLRTPYTSHWVKFFLCFLPLALLRLPLHPDFPTAELDPSWKIILNYAFERGIQWGTDFGFTYGPFGFVATNFYYPSTYLLQLACVCLILIVFTTFSYFRLANLFAGSSKGQWLIPLYFLMISLLSVYIFDIICFLFILQVTISEFFSEKDDKKSSSLIHLVVSVLALISQMKFSYFPLVAMSLLGIAVDKFLNKREFYKPLFTFFVSYILLWLFSGQALSHLPEFFRVSFEISRGYGESMSVAGKPEVLITYLICLFIFLVLLFFKSKKGIQRWVMLATLSIQFLFITKAGFVRADIHVYVATITLGLMLSFLAFFYLERKKAMLALVTCSFVLCQITIHKESSKNITDILMAEFFKIPKATMQFSMSKFGDLYQSSIQELKKQYPLPSLKGGVDIYPVRSSLIVANNFEFHSRPIFQSYSAYTESLIDMNAKFLESDQAPNNILFDISPIDGRYPALDDGLSWLSILSRYKFIGDFNAGLLFEKSNSKKNPVLSKILETPIEFDKEFILPSVDMLWGQLELQPSLVGKFIGWIYKWPIILIKTVLVTGETREYRIIPGPAHAGFLLSPLVLGRQDILNLDKLDRQRLRSFTLHVSSDEAFFFKKARLNLFSLEFKNE